MLQQTQVKTVVPYFTRFIDELPTIGHLAAAPEQQVLRLWQGLGYYSRARNLLRTARLVMTEHAGRLPASVDALLELPGIGRYTAGAIASIAYDIPAPIVDGNVARVLCRLHAIQSPPSQRHTQTTLWEKAARLVPRRRAGDFNSALMELGATVCTRSPRCQSCPLQRFCRARQLGIAPEIPPPRPSKTPPLIVRHSLCLRQESGGTTRWLIEQRPGKGRWAGLWQFITVPATARPPSTRRVLQVTACSSGRPRRLSIIDHSLTHRRYRFEVYLCDVRGRCGKIPPGQPRRWVSLDELDRYPLPRPQVRIAQILSKV
jgi:A/G-specific adenine glycosylase